MTQQPISLAVLLAFTFPALSAERHSGIDPKGFDQSVRVQDDLFLHVNGEWIRHTPIPADKSNYGSFIVLIDEAEARIREIIEAAAASDNAPGSEAQKVGDFFKSYMNQKLVEELQLQPLQELLTGIDVIASKRDLLKHFGQLQVLGVETPVGFFVDQDDKDSSRYLAAVVQSGTTLPDRDYYLKDDDKYQQARESLHQYIVTLFELSGVPAKSNTAAGIVTIEKQLAEVAWTRTELRNAEKRYNKYDTDKLEQLTPQLEWDVFFAAAGVADLKEVNVITPSFFAGLDSIITDTSLDLWKAYLRFKLLDASATILPESYVSAHFELHQKVLAGIPSQKPRWKNAVAAISGGRAGDFGALGDAVGQLFVAKYFTADAKVRMDELVFNLKKAYEQSIDNLTWMTPVTKKQALLKLSKMTTKIGYTEKWRDYTGLQIQADDLFGNVVRATRHEYQRMIGKLGQPVDRTEWGMTPQTVNAYYNPGMNEIVFPAAILQPPFFDATADDAVNYGGIGAVIGHEISHGFDDQGSKYDGDGNLENWWTDEDREAFRQLTERLVEQFSQYEAVPGKTVNGQLTLGENIADLSGVAIAYKAYHLSLAGKSAPRLDGWTGDQRFFLGWGQIWRRKYRDAEIIRRLVIDPHSPSAFRANGPINNLDAFYDAFQVKPGDKLFKPPSERIQIW